MREDASESAKASDDDDGAQESDADGGEEPALAMPAQSALDASASCGGDSCASDARVANVTDAASSASDAGASGASSAPTGDAGPSVNVPLDDTRSKWVGRFATRS